MKEKKPVPPLKGSRRELTAETFEELAALQCEAEEIIGYAGTDRERLARWCRRVYRRPLEETLTMLRQDGLIEIRRAAFDQLRRSATLIQQQYTRFLTAPVTEKERAAARAVGEMLAAASPGETEVKELFGDV